MSDWRCLQNVKHRAATAPRFLRIAFCISGFAMAAASAPGAENGDAAPATEWVTPAAERAVQRGLKWLAGRQHDDGGYGEGAFRDNAAVCALSGMAMMAGGGVPGRGPYGRQIDRSVDFLLAAAQPNGFISSGDSAHGPMYGHGFAVTFLAECHGMSPRADLREKLARAVALIVNVQNKEGGWRYQPVRADADISVTACQIVALRAARNAGLSVSRAAIDRAVDYVKRCQNADGGFMYMVQGGDSASPRSAAAVAALYGAGLDRTPEITRGLDYLLRRFEADVGARREAYYFYARYYAAQAFWQAGGDRWRRWYPAVRDELIARQRADGSWLSSEGGNECATAMACIVLQIPNNYLPIFQR